MGQVLPGCPLFPARAADRLGRGGHQGGTRVDPWPGGGMSDLSRHLGGGRPASNPRSSKAPLWPPGSMAGPWAEGLGHAPMERLPQSCCAAQSQPPGTWRSWDLTAATGTKPGLTGKVLCPPQLWALSPGKLPTLPRPLFPSFGPLGVRIPLVHEAWKPSSSPASFCMHPGLSPWGSPWGVTTNFLG